MRPRLPLLCLALLALAGRATAQAAPQRDPNAIALISQAVTTAGGAAAIAAIQDYTATGKITYYWPGGPVQGTVTLKARGSRQLRIDATLPQGLQSSGFDNGTVWQRETDGAVRQHPFLHAGDPGTSFFPAAELANALADTSVSITDLGLVTVDGQQEHGVRLERGYTRAADPAGTRSKMSARDFFIDPSTFLVVRARDAIYQHGLLDQPVAHELSFSGYEAFDGVLFPLSITETVYRQRTFTIQVTQASFNTGLAGSDFQP